MSGPLLGLMGVASWAQGCCTLTSTPSSGELLRGCGLTLVNTGPRTSDGQNPKGASSHIFLISEWIAFAFFP